ncbi:ETX/MTX2 family pore-forming toxin [Fibrella sp. WM1]|uniref:ETX/MTX2 family pore-forming toxin n=1 Tax=Fibrella musci TaxID=3242485 RepID=UPI0035215C4C
MATSLQDITNAWGNWMNKQYNGGGVKFTASTNYSQHSELDDYRQYEVQANQQPIVYDPNAPAPQPGTVSSVHSQFRNSSSIPQTYTYKQEETTEQSFTWSVTEDLSIGIEVSASVEVPTVAELGTKVTTTVSFSASQQFSTNHSQTWSVEQPVTAPPMTILDTTMVIGTQSYNINWSANCLLTGYVAIWFNDKIKLSGSNDTHHLYFVKIEKVFNDCKQNNLISIKSSEYAINNSSVSAFSSGTFYGGQGVGVQIQVDEQSIGGPSASLAATSNTYMIPVEEDAVLGVEA